MVKFLSPRFIAAAISVLALISIRNASHASPVNIAMCEVGNPGNAPDPTVMVTDTTSGYGSVDYPYSIGMYDVTLTQYAAFLNSVAKTDPYGLYDPRLGTGDQIKGIMRTGTSGAYAYSVIGDGAKPVTFVSWLDAARFCNWLQNGEPATGVEDTATTEEGAYKLDGDTTKGREIKGTTATWWIPAENEWYKAAYYDPTLSSGTGGYWSYPTRSNMTPGNDYLKPLVANQANFVNAAGLYSVTQSATLSSTENYLSPVGSFQKSVSYYGTYDQGGDVYQWNDALIGSLARGARGGQWSFPVKDLESNDRESRDATAGNNGVGFRVASGPPTIAEKAGQYTLLLTPPAGAGIPQGTGYGILGVSSSGSALFEGKLPDSESFSTTGVLVSGNAGIQFSVNIPLSYASVTPANAKGSLTGVLNFKTVSGSDVDATLKWVKPQQTSGDYPAAINTNLAVIGSVYAVKPNGSVLPGFTSGVLELSDTGALSVSSSNELDEAVVLTSSNTLTVTNPKDSLKVTINVSTGVFQGTFLYPTAKPILTGFAGVLYQDQVFGAGLFIGPYGSGPVSLAR
jgi:formylglycine-generating enzyme required for sulfatase activity